MFAFWSYARATFALLRYAGATFAFLRYAAIFAVKVSITFSISIPNFLEIRFQLQFRFVFSNFQTDSNFDLAYFYFQFHMKLTSKWVLNIFAATLKVSLKEFLMWQTSHNEPNVFNRSPCDETEVSR